MQKSQNTRYLLKLWIPAIAIGGIVLLGLGAQLSQGNFLFVVLVLSGAGVLVAATRNRASREVEKLLQSPSPQPLLAYYDRQIARVRVPDADAMLATSRALALILYGRYEEARSEEDKVSWDRRPPLIRAQLAYLKAIEAYLERCNFRQGLVLAQEARTMMVISRRFPGANTALSAVEAVVEIGQVLSGNPEPQVVSSLEAKVNRSTILLRLLVAWGLEGYYSRSGQTDQAEHMRDLLTRIAPYCPGLSKI